MKVQEGGSTGKWNPNEYVDENIESPGGENRKADIGRGDQQGAPNKGAINTVVDKDNIILSLFSVSLPSKHRCLCNYVQVCSHLYVYAHTCTCKYKTLFMKLI